MKKILFLLIALLPSLVFAQLKVDYTGTVSVGDSTLNGFFNVNNKQFAHAIYVLGTGTNCMYLNNYHPDRITQPSYGIRAVNRINTGGMDVALDGYGRNLTPTNGFAIGVRGVGSCDGNGTGYGVLGTANGSTYGAGVYGSTSGTNPLSMNDLYAGYFNGKIKVTGTIEGVLISGSDYRIKSEIQLLSDKNILDKLDLLTPISYKYKQEKDLKEEKDSGDVQAIDNDLVMQKTHFGLIAQELQEVYPNLVYENRNGFLSVNYTELIPVLIECIKELRTELDAFKSEKSVRNMSARGDSNESAGLKSTEVLKLASMDQNMPNPFTEKTDIAIYLPESVKSATLYIYDLSGKQLEQHPVMGRGETVMTIHADKMNAGMYVYSLIADGKVVTTKKMIVVK